MNQYIIFLETDTLISETTKRNQMLYTKDKMAKRNKQM